MNFNLNNKKHSKVVDIILSIVIAVVLFFMSGNTSLASTEMAEEGVYVRQMARGYCTLASAVDMIRSKMYLEGNTSWPNVTQESIKKTAWLNGAGLYHQFTYYGITVTYSTSKCNTAEALISLLNEHPEGIEIYIRDLPHAVLLTRYDAATGIFYVADPVYDGEVPIMSSWQRKAGTTQAAVIKTIDAYWYISRYEDQIIPGGKVGSVYTPAETASVSLPLEDFIINDEELINNSLLINQDEIEEEIIEDILNNTLYNFTKSTVQLPYVNDYKTTNFTDVESGAWYESAIKAAYEMAMMIGISENEFYVKGNITLAQTICITARMHNIYHKNNYDFAPISGESWFLPYIRYTKEQGILDKKYDYDYDKNINYDREALRIEFAEILSKALPKDQMTQIKTVNLITDIPADSNDERFETIYDLYNAGILIGDGEGFKPWNKITRAEIAAIISRMGDASLRIE